MTRITADDLDRAAAKKRGGSLLPAPSSPMAVAREFVAQRYSWPPKADEPALALRHWRGGWWRWKQTHWAEMPAREVSAQLYEFTEKASFSGKNGLQHWDPNRTKIGDLRDALAAVCLLPDDVTQPGWVDRRKPGGAIVACANGLLELSSMRTQRTQRTRALNPSRARTTLRAHTPWFFNHTAVPFGYDPDAPEPKRWLRFLGELWPDATSDQNGKDRVRCVRSPETRGISGSDIACANGAILALQEWFGYVISGRTDLHKILLLVGPTRAGKGVIARILGELVGAENVAGPTLSSLGSEFGLAPLQGKPLAVISDARLNGRDQNIVVERLLSISGEDRLTINRKYREQTTAKLSSRLMVCSNELPQLGDASEAIAGRFVPLVLERSWMGAEDPGLEPALRKELPGIFNWALVGLERLASTGRFTRAPGAEEATMALQDLASPVAAFVRDCCQVEPDRTELVDDVYAAYGRWADLNGQHRKTKQQFGRDLRAVLPRLRVSQPGSGDNRLRAYVGIEINSIADEFAAFTGREAAGEEQ